MAPWDIAAVVLSFVAVIWLGRIVLTGNRAREEEDAARAYFDRHGRWPDED